MAEPTFVSLFSGVGGFDLGLEAAGWRCLAQVERDDNCQAVLAHHWPDVPKWHDVADVRGEELPPADAVAFGSPCQDLSVAGRRAGFGGERSVLFYEATRIIREMRSATDGRYPTWVVWENVAGALSSSGGRDFGAVLDELADLGALDICWRVLDARWFGVPQRRRRVFVVADLAGQRADALLPESPSVPWHPVARPATGEGAPARAGNGASSGCVYGEHGHGHYGPGVTTLRASDETKPRNVVTTYDLSVRGRDGGAQVEITEELAAALRAGDGGSSRSRAIFTQEVAGTLNSGGNAGGFRTEPGEHLVVAQAFSENQRGEVVLTDHAHQITTGGGKPGQGYPAALHNAQVRRLTPVECERLMGWPDDHTRWRADGSEVADSTRYRMCGNGVAAPVAEWIGARLKSSGVSRAGQQRLGLAVVGAATSTTAPDPVENHHVA
jgi:DNA (cytosine-5)-methyltransferase 1